MFIGESWGRGWPEPSFGMFLPFAYVVAMFLALRKERAGALIGGAALGPLPVKAIVAGCIAVAVYLAACQFLAVLRSRDNWRSRWSVFLVTLTPILADFLLVLAVEKRQVVLSQGVPMLASGFIGNLAGALIGAA
jgi:hypothetical protein